MFFLKLILLVFGSMILIFGAPYLTKIEEAKRKFFEEKKELEELEEKERQEAEKIEDM